jgi:hypothetical protein
MISAYAFDKGKETELKFEYGWKGQLTCGCPEQLRGNLSPLIQYNLPLTLNGRVCILLGMPRILRGRGLREEVLNSEDAELDRSGYEYGSRRVSALEAKSPYCIRGNSILTSNKSPPNNYQVCSSPNMSQQQVSPKVNLGTGRRREAFSHTIGGRVSASSGQPHHEIISGTSSLSFVS